MAVDLPHHRIIEKLGVGAQSRVFRAKDIRSGQDVTIKIVKIVKPEDASYVELLKTEHVIGTAIHHPVIRRVFELRFLRQRFRVTGAILFLEYVNGTALSEREPTRSLDEILRVFTDTAQGLHAMHRAGFVHADLKPNNIMITAEGVVKLIDLGQSARIHEAKNKVQGTIDYMAPEQVQRGVLDHRTDVFGLGATLHKVLTGKPIATEINQTVSLHSQSMIGRRLSEIRETMMHDLPACVTRFIDDCCQADPSQRIADMSAVAERLSLARTIVAKQSAESPPAAALTPDPAIDADDFEPHLDDGFDPIIDALGLAGSADDSGAHDISHSE